MAADDHRITLAEAIGYAHTWQKAHPGERKAWMLPREIIDEILKQPGCSGIRVYAGNTSEDPRLVWVGVRDGKSDLVDGVIAEECKPCPIWCDEHSPLVVPAT